MADSWTLRRFDPLTDAPLWDEMVDTSRNATFLHRRGYMDYHADRFTDHSIIAELDGKPVALLPANIDGDTLCSHGGLTYGGWLLPRHKVNANEMGPLMEALRLYCRSLGLTAIDYKPVPYIYASLPAQEDAYWLWRAGAVMTECNLATVIDLEANPGFNAAQRRKLRKGSSSGATYSELTDDAEIAEFHAMLAECLHDRHDVAPVHSAAELTLLHSRFPEQIRFHAMRLRGEIHAGVCSYDTGRVRHLQYIATTAEGRRLDLLTPLMAALIGSTPAGTRFFDFGTSNEDHGRYLNPGLLRQKWELGGSGVAYPRYRLTI